MTQIQRELRRLCTAGALYIQAMAALCLGATPTMAGTLLVVDPAGQQVGFIDTQTGTRRGVTPTGAGPRDIAVSPDGNLALVSNYGTADSPGNSLTLLDIASAQVRGTIDLSPLTRPYSIRWTANGEKAVVAVRGDNALAIVDIARRKLERGDGAPQDGDRRLALSADGRYAFLGDPAGGQVIKIDLADGAQIGASSGIPQAQSIALSPDGTRIWVTDRGDDSIQVLRSDTLEEVTNLLAGNMPMGVALTPNGRYALVSNALSSDVMVFDTVSFEQAQIFSTRNVSGSADAETDTDTSGFQNLRLGRISIPVAIVAADDGLSAYVMNNFSGEIVQYDIFTGVPLRVFQGSRVPGGMAYSPKSAAE